MDMLQHISLGVYYPGNSLLHQLRARTKLLVLLWLMAYLLVANQRHGHYVPYVVLGGLLVAAALASEVGLAHLWRRMRLLVLFAALGAIPLLFFVVGKPLATFGPYPATYAAARWAMLAYGVVVGAFVMVLALVRPWRWRVRRRLWSRLLSTLLALGLVVVGAGWWLTRGMAAAATFPLGPVVITYTGVWIIVSAGMMLLVFYALALLLTMTTAPIALVEGLTRLLAPLRRVGAPVDDFALMLLISLRFIPTLFDEAEQLTKAQMARGADVTHGSVRERLQSMETWFVPLMHGALRRAGELATALEARGYEVQGERTALHEGALGALDWVVLCGVVAVTLLALLP